MGVDDDQLALHTLRSIIQSICIRTTATVVNERRLDLQTGVKDSGYQRSDMTIPSEALNLCDSSSP